MSFFRFYWLRRLIRRHTTPIPYRKANLWRNRLSVAYAICCWNILGYLGYQFYTGKLSKEAIGLESDEFDKLSPAQQFAVIAGIEKAKIIRSSNFEAIDFNLEEFKHLNRDPDSIRQPK